MAAVTFTELLADASRRNIVLTKQKESLDWFKNNSKKFRGDSSSLIREFGKEDLRLVTNLTVGKLYMMMYDPKHKKTLPYYDLFPCIFPIEPYSDGSILAINLHYLHPNARVKLMDALYSLEKGTMPSTKKLQLSYGMLKSASRYKLFQPCLKRYLRSQIRSRFISVPYEGWNAAIFLPVHDFQKASASKVWQDSWEKAR